MIRLYHTTVGMKAYFIKSGATFYQGGEDLEKAIENYQKFRRIDPSGNFHLYLILMLETPSVSQINEINYPELFI